MYNQGPLFIELRQYKGKGSYRIGHHPDFSFGRIGIVIQCLSLSRAFLRIRPVLEPEFVDHTNSREDVTLRDLDIDGRDFLDDGEVALDS